MNPLIIRAIRERYRVKFTYNGRQRIGEPQCYGISTAGKELVRIYIETGRQPEALFETAKMERLEILDETFSRPGPNYKKGDSAMREIFEEL